MVVLRLKRLGRRHRPFYRLTAEERIVRGLERGTLTPAQAVQLAANIEGGKPGLLGAIGGGAMVPLALAGAAAWFFFGGARRGARR